MFLLDDVLLAPVNALFWLFKEIEKTAREEVESEPERITTELSRLYMLLETGKITEAEFEEREHSLLDRLDALDAAHELEREAEADEEIEEESLPIEEDDEETTWKSLRPVS